MNVSNLPRRPNTLMGFLLIAFGIAFVSVIGLMIAGGIWNYSLYRDCINDGKKAYQCKAMLDGGARYIAVDDVTEK